jgi:hypothetical protein
MVTAMFRSAFLDLSQRVCLNSTDFSTACESWSHFLENTAIVRVTGESPNDSDSGYLFTRYAKQYLEIPENRIYTPESAARLVKLGQVNRVVFVDDFVGSGDQFIKTWKRSLTVGGERLSFQSLSAATTLQARDTEFYYCPLICTKFGAGEIASECPDVEIVAAHTLDPRQSALSPESFIWREDMALSGPTFVRKASERAGIPNLSGEVGCWSGYHALGLALAFDHGWPDATLPIFYHDKNGWLPLLKRDAS